jgi:hypothetical protein
MKKIINFIIDLIFSLLINVIMPFFLSAFVFKYMHVGSELGKAVVFIVFATVLAQFIISFLFVRFIEIFKPKQKIILKTTVFMCINSVICVLLFFSKVSFSLYILFPMGLICLFSLLYYLIMKCLETKSSKMLENNSEL